MKTKTLKSIFAIIILAISLNSCSKNEETVTAPPPPGKSEFLYAEGGAPTFSSTSDATARTSSGEIFGRNGGTEIVKIKLSSLVVGFYEINAVNQFTYTRPATSSPWIAGMGSIIITEVTPTTISGAFELNSGTSTLGINTVKGIFNNVPIQP